MAVGQAPPLVPGASPAPHTGSGRRIALPDARGVVGAIGALGIVFGVTMIVLIATDRLTFLVPPGQVSFPHWMAGPLQGLSGLHPSFAHLRVLFTATMGGLFVSYLVLLIGVPALRLRWVIAAVAFVHVILFLSPPLSLTDVFNYLNYGRMGALHHLNPYTTVPALGDPNDPSFALSNWHHLKSPYGPLLTLLTYALAPLGVPAAFWVWKFIVMCSSLGLVYLVYRAAVHLEREPSFPVAVVGLNPLVLVWGLGGDHSEATMMLALFGGVLLLMLGREALGAAAAVTAVAIKASAVVAVPVLLCAAVRKRQAVLGAAVAAVVLGLITLAVFGPHTPDISDQSKVVNAIAIPNLLGLWIGQGGATDTLREILQAGLVLVVLGACVQTWRGHPLMTWIGVTAVGSLLILTWVVPWYVLWLLPFAALSRSKVLFGAALFFSLWLTFTWVPMMQDAIHAIGLHPTSTALGHEHSRLTHSLLDP